MAYQHNYGLSSSTLLIVALATLLTSSCTQQTSEAQEPLQATAKGTTKQQPSEDASPNQEVTQNSSPITRLYDTNGNEITSFEGDFISFSKDGQQLLTHPDHDDQTTHLYDITGHKLADLKGRFRHLSDDGQWIVVYSQDDATTRLYDTTGQEQVSLKGYFSRFSTDGQRLVTNTYAYNNSITRLYNIDGQELASFSGSFSYLSKNGQWLIIDSETEPASHLYDSAGNQLINFQGEFTTISDNEQQLITYEALTTRLYDITGQELTTIVGEFIEFSYEGEWIKTYSYDTHDEFSNHFHDITGKRLSLPEEHIVSISDDGQRLIVKSPDHSIFSDGGQRLIIKPSDNAHRLYDSDGNKLADLNGRFTTFSNNRPQIIVQSEQTKAVILYDYDGHQKNNKPIEGQFGEFHPQHDLLVTTSKDDDISRVYDYAGNLLAEVPGTVIDFQEQFGHEFSGYRDEELGFTPDGNYLLTITKDGNPHLWQLDIDQR